MISWWITPNTNDRRIAGPFETRMEANLRILDMLSAEARQAMLGAKFKDAIDKAFSGHKPGKFYFPMPYVARPFKSELPITTTIQVVGAAAVSAAPKRSTKVREHALVAKLHSRQRSTLLGIAAFLDVSVSQADDRETIIGKISEALK